MGVTKELRISLIGIKMTLIALGITLLLSAIPFFVESLPPKLKLYASYFVGIVFIFLSCYLFFYVAPKIKIPKKPGKKSKN